MKPHFHKVPVALESSFSIRHDVKENFGSVLHYHPELELHCVVKGEGVQFIGDTIRNFSSGEMMLLGENVPHTWRCSEEYFRKESTCRVEALVLQFLPTCFGRDFLELPETIMIRRLFERAKGGLMVQGEKKDQVYDLLLQMLHASNVERLIYLLSILNILATDVDEMTTVTSSYARQPSNSLEVARLDKIYTYVLNNFRRDITLEEIASFANMSQTSFCRYFKLMMNRTFSEFLTEVRITQVCRTLLESNRPMQMVCFECGFNNVSNFYRHFKKVTKLTPLEYKSRYYLGLSKSKALA